MKLKLFVLLIALFPTADLFAETPATQPAGATSIEIRAQEEFGRANWGAALPLLNKVAQQFRDQNQPDRLGAIEEQIRVCEKNLKAAATIAPGNSAPITGENRKPHAAPKAGETREMAIKDLGNFEYDADIGGGVPDDVKALNGSSIKLHGFMIPMDQADSITQFALVPSLFACCFGQPPQVQHTIVVHLPKGKGVSYFPDEISVEGKLIVDEKKEDGFIVSLFEIDASSVKPATK
ncbi:MAG: DUF3299 domain-containing protein [Anaerolineae bacterium]|nr:DUF3299 domain-containing protein [Phycisphaerae bacterium]